LVLYQELNIFLLRWSLKSNRINPSSSYITFCGLQATALDWDCVTVVLHLQPKEILGILVLLFPACFLPSIFSPSPVLPETPITLRVEIFLFLDGE
jgi:hypothetical protein